MPPRAPDAAWLRSVALRLQRPSMPSDNGAMAAAWWRVCLGAMLAGMAWLVAVSVAGYWWTGYPGAAGRWLPACQAIGLHLAMVPGLAALSWSYFGLWAFPPPFEARRELVWWAVVLSTVAAAAAFRVYWTAALVLVTSMTLVYGRRTSGPQSLAEHSLRIVLLHAFGFWPHVGPWYLTWGLTVGLWTTSDQMRRFLTTASIALLLSYVARADPLSGLVTAGVLCDLLLILGREVTSRGSEREARVARWRLPSG